MFLLNDHATIDCHLNIKKQPPTNRKAAFKRFNKVNNILFREDLTACFLDTSSAQDCQFTSLITDIIDKHAQLTTRKNPSQTFPCYSVDIKLAKQERRKAERRCNHTGSTIHRDIFKNHRRKLEQLI